MIYVSSGLKRDFIKDLLEGQKGDITFKHVDTKGIKMGFDINGADQDQAVALAKSVIKGSEVGSALYFSVTTY